MIIKDEHILEAEKLLIGDAHFDTNERIPFIKNLEAHDLLAVPGSGKTTALLAKLYCLSMQMPFKDGTGILVLSHTNAAVDEIMNKLKNHCPQLFQYPNFVGTVQSFTNKFLANIGCCKKYGSYITINDNDIYESEAIKFFNSLQWKKGEPKGLKNKLFGMLNIGKDGLGFHEKVNNIIEFLKKFELDIINRKIIYINKTKLKHNGHAHNYYLELEQWKESLYAKGILNFIDTYSIAMWYLSQFPESKTLLQKRFRYIFIDETQDLEKYQLDLINSIFVGKDSENIIQRVGDINQSIYHPSKDIKTDCDWNPHNPLFLKDSLRLSPEIARVVDSFTLKRCVNENVNDRFCVIGKNNLNQTIKPHLILFDVNSKDKLKSTFEKLIKQFHLHDDEENNKKGYKIIGWNGSWKDGDITDGKLRLENIFPNEYSKKEDNSKEWHSYLGEYLQYSPKYKTLSKYQKNIILSLCSILRLSGKKLEVKRHESIIEIYFTPTSIWKWFMEQSQNENSVITEANIIELKTKLLTWSFSIATQNNIKETYDDIKEFICTKFKDWFDIQINKEIIYFLGDDYKKTSVVSHFSAENDKTQGVPIEIGTVHSVKGQTHCATMYVETSFYKYETEHLMVKAKNATKTKEAQYYNNPLFQEEHNYKDAGCSRAKQSMKMMYVGFSRPTHLLCFAVLKDNLNKIETLRDKGWEIVDITNE